MARFRFLFFGLSIVVLGTFMSPVGAQQPPPVTPVPRPAPQLPQQGDVLWTFAPELPFADERVAIALAATIDPNLRTAGSRVFFAQFRGPDVLAPTDAPTTKDQIPLLLAAAGFPNGFGELNVVGRCG